MKSNQDQESKSRHNALVRFAIGFGDVVEEYRALRDDARRRYPGAFR